MTIEPRIPLLEEILEPWKDRIGTDYPGYKHHVYRVAHFCFALQNCDVEAQQKIIIAACFHDIGIWADHTPDYLPPSIAQAKLYLSQKGLEQWAAEIELMIGMHHKLRRYRDHHYPLVEVFRKGDLVDFSLGMIKCGLPGKLIRDVKKQFPNAGFHKFLAKGIADWFARHPLTPPPFLKW